MPTLGEPVQIPLQTTWGVMYVQLFPHPDDLEHVKERHAQGLTGVAEGYVCKSYLRTNYGQFDSTQDYADRSPVGDGGWTSDPRATGEFGFTGDWVKPIVEMVGFHATVSELIARGLRDDLTPTELGQCWGVKGARRAMAGTTADFGFGIEPFEITQLEQQDEI